MCFNRTGQVTSVDAALLIACNAILVTSLNPPVFFCHTLATVSTLAPHPLLISAANLSPERDIGTKGWVVNADTFAKHWAQGPVHMVILFLAPVTHIKALAAVAAPLPAAFQARSSILISAVPEAFKVDDCLLVFRSGCFLEWIFVAPVEAVVLFTIPELYWLDALARDGLCSITPLRIAAGARTSDEAL